MSNIISQTCGLIVSAAAITSMQLKNIKLILLCLIICNGVGAASYILLGGLSGCGIYLVALVQTIVCFFFRLKDKKVHVWVVIFFLALYILCLAMAYKSPIDIISALAAVTCALSLIQEKPSRYRILMLMNGILWMIYDVNVSAYTMIISHIATTVSAGVGIIRLDLIKRK